MWKKKGCGKEKPLLCPVFRALGQSSADVPYRKIVRARVRAKSKREWGRAKGKDGLQKLAKNTLLYQIHFTLGSESTTGLEPVLGSTVPKWNLNRPSLGFMSTHQFTFFTDHTPPKKVLPPKVLSWSSTQAGFGSLGISVCQICHLTNLIPLSAAPEGLRSVFPFRDSIHKIMNKGSI